MEVIDRTLLPCSLRTKADQIVSASVYFVFACLSFTCSALVQHIFFLAYSLMPYTNPNTVNRPLIKWDPGVPGSPPPPQHNGWYLFACVLNMPIYLHDLWNFDLQLHQNAFGSRALLGPNFRGVTGTEGKGSDEWEGREDGKEREEGKRQRGKEERENGKEGGGTGPPIKSWLRAWWCGKFCNF